MQPGFGCCLCKKYCTMWLYTPVYNAVTCAVRYRQHRVSRELDMVACRNSGPPSTSGREGAFHYTGNPHPPIVRGTLQAPGQVWDQHPWQKCVTEFTGTEPRDTMIPRWLCDAVLLNRIPSVKESKAGFSLMPAQVLFYFMFRYQICACAFPVQMPIK